MPVLVGLVCPVATNLRTPASCIENNKINMKKQRSQSEDCYYLKGNFRYVGIGLLTMFLSEIGLYNQTMSFLRYSSLAFLMSALVSTRLVARTLFLSPPLLFLIFRFNYLRGFLLGFLLPIILSLLRRQVGSYLTRYCWLSQARQNPEERFPPKAVLNPQRTMFLPSQWYLLAISSRRSFWDTLGFPSWQMSNNSSFRANSLLTLSLLVLIVTAIKQQYLFQILIITSLPDPPTPPKSSRMSQNLNFLVELSEKLKNGEKIGKMERNGVFLVVYNINCNNCFNMNYEFLLMRHARSRHNKQKQSWRAKYQDKTYKQLPLYQQAKYSPDLVDSSEVDLEQCTKAKQQHLDLKQIALVICSPLRRCLQTCKHVIEGHKEFSVVVEPLLCSRLSAAWSVGSSATQLSSEYPSFDFSLLKEDPQTWMLRMVASNSQESYLLQQTPANKSTQEYLLSLLAEGFQQTYQQFFRRTRQLKERMLTILNNHIKPTTERTKILVISHSCVLSFLLGSQLGQNGKIKNKESFEHCQPKKFSYQKVLSGQQQASL